APEEMVFTSGGTEGNELAIRGLLRGVRVARGAPSPAEPSARRPLPLRGRGEDRSFSLAPRSGERVGVRGRLHVVTSRLEHPSVAAALAGEDADVTYVNVGRDGGIDVEALRAALRPDTALVTLALANHELGTVYDIAALARAAHEVGALFHTDAVQAGGKLVV